jgi:23S rRNA pseudouridine1911/1915/1917 synthase
MAKPKIIDLDEQTPIPILYEDRSVLAIDKPAGWLLAPDSWDRTGRNLQLAIQSSIRAGEFWARSRHLKFLRFVHRLDGETSGVLLMARSAGALPAYTELFESRQMEKIYLAVIAGIPSRNSWVCQQKIGPDPQRAGRMRIDARHGKEAETHFKVLQTRDGLTLLETRPATGRTHQIRLHLQASGFPVVGDRLYRARTCSPQQSPTRAQLQNRAKLAAQHQGMGLRAIMLAYRDPFTQRPVRIEAPVTNFIESYGFNSSEHNTGKEPH